MGLQFIGKRPAKYRCAGCDFFSVIVSNPSPQDTLDVQPALSAHTHLGDKVAGLGSRGTAIYAASLAGAEGTIPMCWDVVGL